MRSTQSSVAAPERAAAAAGLSREWRRLGRAATFVALLTSPALYLALHNSGWSVPAAVLGALFGVIAFRGLVDIAAHRLVPRPGLEGADKQMMLNDAAARRRLWFWRARWFHTLPKLLVLVALIYCFGLLLTSLLGFSSISLMWSTVQAGLRQDPLAAVMSIMQLALFPLFFLFNFAILFGPLLAFGLMQMKGYEPGDADWGVKLDHVRGQKEPKEEVTRVITLWQGGDRFRESGGKPERGLLFIGAPGTGKTMLSKGIATSFNSPIVTMPGSGFAQTFVGLDVAMVMLLIRKARRLARKWGGQCIIFIDEIDAVGLRRQALGAGGVAGGFGPSGRFGAGALSFDATGGGPGSFHDYAFHGPHGALNPSGDLILETRAWRERIFASRAEPPRAAIPGFYTALGERINRYMMPGMFGGGGGMALNQLLVQMDGVDEPPFFRKQFTNRLNTLLDAAYVVPQRVGSRSLRLRPPKPRSEQIYFIGATNVPIDRLDPALIRPGRMGRHIWFRTPTADDRKDIFDLYLGKVDHDPDLDSDARRDELARITNGYSPAMIEQVCSMALTLAHSDARPRFEWGDIVEAMTTIESGTAQGIDYVPAETRAVAIHEAGHAAASHVYMHDVLSTRLSIRKRGGSLGHHQAIEKEERFSSWRHEEVGKLVWTLGAMAAEHVFYGENSTGVGGDVESATARAAWMVGMCGMGPEPVDLSSRPFPCEEDRAAAEERLMKRFERIGLKIMNRARSSREQGDAIAAVLGDPAKRTAAAQILGQAYLTAVCLIRHNREQVLRIAETLIERRELHGDEVVEVLDAAELQAPSIDVADESIWPQL
jgi:ATP-dependent Zn protease